MRTISECYQDQPRFKQSISVCISYRIIKELKKNNKKCLDKSITLSLYSHNGRGNKENQGKIQPNPN